MLCLSARPNKFIRAVILLRGEGAGDSIVRQRLKPEAKALAFQSGGHTGLDCIVRRHRGGLAAGLAKGAKVFDTGNEAAV